MLSVSKIMLMLLVLRLFTSVLKAQHYVAQHEANNGFRDSDSSLFFLDFTPGLHDIGNTGKSTCLYGPYLDSFPQTRSDLLTALSYYPELSQVKIRFLQKSIRQTMNARPAPGNIFRKKADRIYTIIVNDNKGKHKGLQYSELSSIMRTGWLGHELAHICAYTKMDAWPTLCFAVKYVLSKKYVRKVERYTDLVTIEHGLALPLYLGTDYLLRNQEIGERYRQYAIVNGLSLSEIKFFWRKLQSEHVVVPAEIHAGEK